MGVPSFTKKTRNTGKTPKYRKDPEIPERPVNGSIHARVSGGGEGKTSEGSIHSRVSGGRGWGVLSLYLKMF